MKSLFGLGETGGGGDVELGNDSPECTVNSPIMSIPVILNYHSAQNISPFCFMAARQTFIDS